MRQVFATPNYTNYFNCQKNIYSLSCLAQGYVKDIPANKGSSTKK